MKKLILIIVSVLIINKQYAQIEKGTSVPGFSLSGIYTKSHANSGTYLPYYDNSQINYQAGVSLKYGKFVKNNLLLGCAVGYLYNDRENTVNYQSSYPNTTEKSKQNSVNAGVYLSKYKLIKNDFYITYGANFGLSYTESNNNNVQALVTYDSLGVAHFTSYPTTSFDNSVQASLNLTAGINYFVTQNLAITGSLGFLNASYTAYPYQKKNNEVDRSNIDVRLFATYNAFSAGLVYFIRPKKD